MSQQQQAAQKPAPRPAGQRIEDLENAVMGAFNTMDHMARDIMLHKDTIKLLSKKLNAVVEAVSNGEQPTDEVLNRIMTKNNVEELAHKVAELVAQGRLHPEEVSTENSFVVGEEFDENGVVANPRLQFAVSSLQDPLKGKIIGLKAGEAVSPEEGKLSFRLLETYRIGAPEAPAAEAPAESSETPAEASASGETA